ncbi:MAG: lipopolysaccharide heptosyltransferase II [Caldimicrobium sp.]|jgi:heptosyltransferase-2|nr:lipopolysaccharide heptosyltransferase II [Caldimicrobium sp.]
MLVRTPNWLGDALMATPVYYNLSKLGKVYLFGHKNFINLFSHFPNAATIPYDPSDFFKNIKILRELIEKEKLTQGLLLTNSFSSAFIFFLARVEERIGYRGDLRDLFLTKAIDKPKKPVHQVDYYLYLLEALGIPIVSRDLYFLVNESLLARAKKVLTELKLDERTPYVVFAPGAAYGPAKKWPLEYFKEVAKELSFEGISVLVVGGRAEFSDGEFIISEINRGYNLCGKTSIEDLPGLFLGAKALVSNDSGLMHLGAALKVPQVAIFGSTSPELTGPKNPRAIVLKKDFPCSPCFRRTCKHEDYRCLKSITPDEVLKSLAKLMNF